MSKVDLVSYVLTQSSLEHQSDVSSRSGQKLSRAKEEKQAIYAREDELRAEQQALKSQLWGLEDDGAGTKFLRGVGSFFGFDNSEDHVRIDIQRLDVDQQKLQAELGRLSRVGDQAANDVKQAMSQLSDAIEQGREAAKDAEEAVRRTPGGAVSSAGRGSLASASLSAHGLATEMQDVAKEISASADSKLRDAIERQAEEAHAALDLREDKLGGFGIFGIFAMIGGIVAGFFTGGATVVGAVSAMLVGAAGGVGVSTGTKNAVQAVKNHAAAGHEAQSEAATLVQDQSNGRIEMADRIDKRASAQQRAVAQTQREIRDAARTMRG